MLTEKIKEHVNSLKTDLKVKKKERDLLIQEKEDLEKNIQELNIDTLNKSIVVLQKLSKQQREQAKMRLEDLGTQALKYSMGSKYRMRIDIDDTRKRPQTYLYIVDEETGLETDPLEENGGGVVDIISIALQLMTLQSQEPVVNGPIILDEPFKMVSKEYVPALSEFLKNISTDFGRQNIVITHNEYLAESCEHKIQF